MSGFGSVSQVHGNEEQLRVNALFKGGGSATDAVIQTTGHKTVKSLTYNSATGKFLLNLWDWPGVLVKAGVTCKLGTGVIPLLVSVDWANISKTAFTIPVEFWTAATEAVAAALVDPVTTAYIEVELVFQKAV